MGAYLREAGWEDVDLLFTWANDPAVRRNSFSTEEILYERHKEWYRALLADPNRRQYLYVWDGGPIGQARIVATGEEAEVSYSICADKRGMGHGVKLLQILREQMKTDFPQVKYLTARVKAENRPSQKAFLRAGYKKTYEAYRLPCIESDEPCSIHTGTSAEF